MSLQMKLFDVVAPTRDLPEQRLLKGQVGTIVECYEDGEFEVEFADNKGRTYALVAINPQNLMLLHYKPVEVGAGTDG